MKYILLNNTDLRVSALALGTGSFFSHISNQESEKLLDYYFEQGGNLFDTANYYGRWNPGNQPLSEIYLGKWIKKRELRNKIILGTKGACYPVNRPDIPRVTVKDISHDLHESLKNLQTDYIDFYWLHQDDPTQPVDAIIDLLNKFVTEGKIRYFGCSNWSVERMEQAKKYAEGHHIKSFSASQVMYNLASPNMSALHELKQTWVCDTQQKYYEKNKMPLFAYTSQAMGIFSLALRSDFLDTDKYQNAKKYFYNEITLKRIQKVKKLSKNIGHSPIEICLAFLLSHPFQIIPIIGPYQLDELQESLNSSTLTLQKETIEWLLT
ncbi:putative aldo-keto reductase [uncultured Ruminococcus sp.]|jgi:aryl-alcohol dehydrogenase-like predicted oxidoreductase|nr:putative aldo-keto reductase [uncultured Clostridium sp.]SCI45543.1 putative aldo-keto reductase [uncultured Ruminococcus sp.]